MSILGQQKLEKLLVLFDIQTLFVHPQPSKILSLVTGFIKRLLDACNENEHSGSTVWAYKLIDSSMTPLASRSKIERLIGSFATYARFDSTRTECKSTSAPAAKTRIADHFTTFCLSLKNLVYLKARSDNSSQQAMGARADNVARALQELLTDYTWDTILCSDAFASEEQLLQPKASAISSLKRLSNLIVLFSPLPRACDQYSTYVSGIESSLRFASNDIYIQQFCSKLSPVLEKLNAKEVHTCWVDLPTSFLDPVSDECASFWDTSPNLISETSAMKALRRLGCRFISLENLVMGSISMPCSLFLPSVCHDLFQLPKKHAGASAKLHLCLQGRESSILQVPICKLQLMSVGTPEPLRFSPNGLKDRINDELVPFKLQENSIPLGSSPRVNIVIRTLLPMHHVKSCGLSSSQCFLVSRRSGRGNSLVPFNEILDHDHIHNNSSAMSCNFEVGKILGNNLLKMLQQDPEDFEPGKPAWQLLLLFIARQKSFALIDISHNNSLVHAILEPYTIHTAVVRVVNDVDTLFELRSFPGLCLDYLSVLPDDERIAANVSEMDVLTKMPVCNLASSEPPCHEEKIKGNISLKVAQLTQMPTRVLRKRVVRGSYQMELRSKKCKVVKSDPVNTTKKAVSLNKLPCTSKVDKMNINTQLQNLEAETFRNSWGTLMLEYLCSINVESKQAGLYKKLENALSFDKTDVKTVRSITCWMKQMSKHFSHNLDIKNCKDGCSHSSLWMGVQHWLKRECLMSEFLIETSGNDPLPGNLVCPSPVTLADVSNCEEIEVPVFSFEQAQNFISSIHEKIANCLNSAHGMDVEGFAKRMVVEARQALLVLRELDTPQQITSQLKKFLLQNPKKLAVKYKHCKSVASENCGSRADDTQFPHSEKDKVREHELQIKLRLEILSTNNCQDSEELMKVEFVKDICRLLEDIQFNLPGGIFQGESLLDFSNRVIQSRYITWLPNTVKEIYTSMEFNGYTDPSSALDPPLHQEKEDSLGMSSKEAFSSQGNGQRSENSSKDTDENNLSHSGLIPSQRGKTSADNEPKLYQNLHTRKVSKNRLRELASSTDDQLIKEAQAKRERSRRLAHFECKAKDLLRLRVMKPVASVKIKSKNQKSIIGKQLVNDAVVELVMETPMPKEKYNNKPIPQ